MSGDSVNQPTPTQNKDKSLKALLERVVVNNYTQQRYNNDWNKRKHTGIYALALEKRNNMGCLVHICVLQPILQL